MLSDASCSEGSPIPAKVRTGGYRLLRTFSLAPRLVTAALILLVILPPSAFGETGRAEPASNLMLKMTKRREGNLIHFFVQNLESAGVTATFESGLVNMRSSTSFPCTMTFRPGETAEAFT